MNCQECDKKPATVHLTKIINNKKTEVHLCEECARQTGELNMFTPFSINDLLSSFLEVSHEPSAKLNYNQDLKCNVCNMTYNKFKTTGRLGCYNCYSSFEAKLTPLIKRIQANVQHTGKLPKKAGIEIRLKRDIQYLKTQLDSAIEEEEFEKAAEIRDKIKEIKSKITN